MTNPHHFARAFVAVLLAGASVPASAGGSGAAAGADAAGEATAEAQPRPDPSQQEIIIYGNPLFRDIAPNRNLDEDAIESYGVSTIDELIGEIQVELGSDADLPLFIVNGQRLNDLSEIGSLPVEVLRNVQVLPRGSALRAGGTSNQRVVNITLKRETKSATATAAHKVATDGDWNADRAEGILTYVRGDNRANLTVRTRDETALLEADRSIIQPIPFRPYSIGGNIVGYPNGLGEIDPLLSALAGEIVTVVPVPGSTTPSLAQLVAAANQTSTTDVGLFRTLRPDSRNYDVNATFATRFAPWLTGNATLRWNRATSDSLRGLPATLFVLSPANPASPFSTTAALARYGASPLQSRSTRSGGEGTYTFNANWSRWQANLQLRQSRSNSFNSIERAASSQVTLTNDVNPFTASYSDLVGITTSRTSSRSVNSLVDLTLNGPLFKLPAGDLTAIVEGRLGWDRLRATSTFSGAGNGIYRRAEQSLRGALEIPLADRESGFLAEIGDLDASIEYTRTHFSDIGSISHYTYGFTWQPRPAFRLHAAIDSTSIPAPIQLIGDPPIVSPDVRMFDPVTGTTVDVTQIYGGNPSLLPERTKTRNVTALVNLVPRLNLQLNAEYIDTERRNFVSGLPEASAAVTLAFPDRFIRNSSGVLTTVDLRPVNFESHREKRLRWGISMNTRIGSAATGQKRVPGRPVRPGTHFQLTANHTMVFSDEIRIRPGLDSVDLLSGGAIGIGGGRTRHQLDSTAALNSGGLGARMGVTWRGASELDTRIGGIDETLRFSPLFLVNLRTFADVKRFLPEAEWAKGLRLSLDVTNLTNNRQTVRASGGSTPLQYQPAYRDPLGRTIEVELRKVF